MHFAQGNHWEEGNKERLLASAWKNRQSTIERVSASPDKTFTPDATTLTPPPSASLKLTNSPPKLAKLRAKHRKRRKNSDGVFRAPGSSSGSEDLSADLSEDDVSTKKRKTRKILDGTFRAPPSDDESDDDVLTKERKTKLSLHPRTPANKFQSLRQSPSSQLTPNLPQFRQESSKGAAFKEPYFERPAPPVSLQLLTPGQTPADRKSPARTAKKRPRSNDDTYVHPSIEGSDDDVLQDRRKKAVKTNAAPSQSALPYSTANAAKTSPPKIKSTKKVAGDEHNVQHLPKIRRYSLYTKAAAERDAKQDEGYYDEPSPTKLKKELMHSKVKLKKMRLEKLELQRQKGIVDKADWFDGEFALFEKLIKLDAVPQLPVTWKPDFAAVKSSLFAPVGENTFIKSSQQDDQNSTYDFRASKAFHHLSLLGSYARDKAALRERPEMILARGIKAYIKWAYNDGKLDDSFFYERLIVVKDDIGHDPDPQSTVTKLETRIRALALEHRMGYIDDNDLKPTHRKVEKAQPAATSAFQIPAIIRFGPFSKIGQIPQKERTPSWWERLLHWTKPTEAKAERADPDVNMKDSNGESGDSEPEQDSDAMYELHEPDLPNDMGMIYGILVSHLIVQVVAYQVAHPEGKFRIMLVCDFSDETQDVWNALALGTTVCHARDEIMQKAKQAEYARRLSDLYDSDL